MRIATIVGTRPELIKLSAVIKKLDAFCDHTLIHTGQNFDFELNEIFFQDLGIRRPDSFLEVASDSYAKTLAGILVKSHEVLEKLRPDALLLYGDTNSCLSVIVAKKLKIPIFHMEAGNRCFDERVPEELNRKIVDHLSDINMPISEHARNYLISEGIAPNKIIKIGSSMPEVLANQKIKIDDSKILSQLGLTGKAYIVVSLHREENVDSIINLTKIVGILNRLTSVYDMKVVFSVHPRTRMRLENFDLKEKLSENILQLKPLGFNDYVHLQQNSFCVVSDSGTISEESSILGFPAVTIRESHERPEAMDEGTLIMTGLDETNVIDSIKIVTNREAGAISVAPDYKPENVSEKVIRVVYSYVNYINRNVWKKY